MIATETASYSDIVFGLFRCWATGSPRASPTWATSGSGARPCPATRQETTGR